MSRVVVIGATGHIGTYLVPRLVCGGHEVIAMSRGAREPYQASPLAEKLRAFTELIKDLSGLVGFLASDASGYLTSQTIVIDGGYTAV